MAYIQKHQTIWNTELNARKRYGHSKRASPEFNPYSQPLYNYHGSVSKSTVKVDLEELIYGTGFSMFQSEESIFKSSPNGSLSLQIPRHVSSSQSRPLRRNHLDSDALLSVSSDLSSMSFGSQSLEPDPLETTSKEPLIPIFEDSCCTHKLSPSQPPANKKNSQAEKGDLDWIENWNTAPQLQQNQHDRRDRNGGHQHHRNDISRDRGRLPRTRQPFADRPGMTPIISHQPVLPNMPVFYSQYARYPIFSSCPPLAFPATQAMCQERHPSHWRHVPHEPVNIPVVYNLTTDHLVSPVHNLCHSNVNSVNTIVSSTTAENQQVTSVSGCPDLDTTAQTTPIVPQTEICNRKVTHGNTDVISSSMVSAIPANQSPGEPVMPVSTQCIFTTVPDVEGKSTVSVLQSADEAATTEQEIKDTKSLSASLGPIMTLGTPQPNASCETFHNKATNVRRCPEQKPNNSLRGNFSVGQDDQRLVATMISGLVTDELPKEPTKASPVTTVAETLEDTLETMSATSASEPSSVFELSEMQPIHPHAVVEDTDSSGHKGAASSIKADVSENSGTTSQLPREQFFQGKESEGEQAATDDCNILPSWADPMRVQENPTRYSQVQQYLKQHGIPASSSLPLPQHLTFYFRASQTASKQKVASENYLSTVCPVFNCCTVREYASRWRRLKEQMSPSQLQPNQNVYCFVKGVAPMWEDPANKAGGRVIISSPKKALDDVFEWTLASFVGGNLEMYGMVGIVCSRRPRSDRVELWLNNSVTAQDMQQLKEHLMSIIPNEIGELIRNARFKKHFDK